MREGQGVREKLINNGSSRSTKSLQIIIHEQWDNGGVDEGATADLPDYVVED